MAKKKKKNAEPKPPERIVSLLPGATEIICEMGLRGKLVAVSHECDTPSDVTQLPRVTSSRIDPNASSAEIHREVVDAMKEAEAGEALSVYSVNTKLLDKLKPDVIVTQSQCAVCAVSLEEVERAVCEAVSTKPAIVSLEPSRLEDLWVDIERLAEALGVSTEGAKMVGELRGRVDAIGMRSSEAENKPKVACIEWLDPLMAAGNWVPQLIEAAGGDPVLGKAGEPSQTVTFEDIVKADPDVLIVAACGWGIARARGELDTLLDREGFTDLKAARGQRVYLADGNRYFNRSGPKLVETTEILAEILLPKAYDFGHEGEGWVHIPIDLPEEPEEEKKDSGDEDAAEED